MQSLYLNTLIVNNDLGKYVKTLIIIIDLEESSWNYVLGMKQSESRI